MAFVIGRSKKEPHLFYLFIIMNRQHGMIFLIAKALHKAKISMELIHCSFPVIKIARSEHKLLNL